MTTTTRSTNCKPSSSRKQSVLLIFVSAFLMGIGFTPLHAMAAPPKVCIPRAVGVPGQPGAPDWWTVGQDPNTRAYTAFDPRWRGAASLDYGTGTTSDVEFRALHDQQGPTKSLLFSWFVKSAVDIDPDDTAFYVGISPNPADKAQTTIIRFKLTQPSTVTAGNWEPKPRIMGGITYFDVTVFGWDNVGRRWITVTTPAWIDNTARVWMRDAADTVNNPAIVGVTPESGKEQWVVQLKIPVDPTGVNGININPDSFRMWHYAQLSYTYNPSTPPAVIAYTWPRPADPVMNPVQYVYQRPSGVHTFPDPTSASTEWGEFSTLSPAVAGCTGITLTGSDIGTTNAMSQSYIDVDGATTFFARPRNTDSQAVAPNVLSATFRFANWGSQVGNLTDASWVGPPQLNLVQDTSGIPGSGQGNIERAWTPDHDWKCKFIGESGVPGSQTRNGVAIPGDPSCGNPNPELILHQCMLVKLNGPGLNFLNDSAFRNMDFVQASEFSRGAEVSVVGLPALPGGSRDVYLYVEQLNMPRHKQSDKPANKEPDPGLQGRQKELRAILRQGHASSMDHDRLATFVPTYIVHAYHDTGIKLSLDQGESRLLLPQTSFGYFVQHEGPPEDTWSDKLGGAQPLGSPNHYVIAVPNNGAAKITTTIRAGQAGTPPSCGCFNLACWIKRIWP